MEMNAIIRERGEWKIRTAETAQEKEAIYRFRYKIFVEELHKNLSADSIKKRMCDGMDDWGIQICAFDGDAVVGAVRVNVGLAGRFEKQYADGLRFDAFAARGKGASIGYVSHLLVDKPYRNSMLFYALIAQVWDALQRHRVSFAFTAAETHLLRLFERIGFLRYGENFYLSGYGLVLPAAFVADGCAHLRRVRSPLCRKCGEMLDDGANMTWFLETFHPYEYFLQAETTRPETLWADLCERMGRSPLDAIGMLKGLTEAEAMRFVHCCGSILLCREGDLICEQGMESYTCKILLSGGFESETMRYPAKFYAEPGACLGAPGLVERRRHTEDLVAKEPSEILVLTSAAFPRYCNANFDAAHKIITNLLADQ